MTAIISLHARPNRLAQPQTLHEGSSAVMSQRDTSSCLQKVVRLYFTGDSGTDSGGEPLTGFRVGLGNQDCGFSGRTPRPNQLRKRVRPQGYWKVAFHKWAYEKRPPRAPL